MAKYRLTYFDFSASRGLECRLAMHLAGVDFEDNRISFDQWSQLKPTTPYGSLPMLERDGEPVLGQCNAILAYIGRQYGLHPKDPWKAAMHEAIFNYVESYRAIAQKVTSKDEAEKKQLREEFAAGYLQTWAKSLESQIEGPFFEGDEIHIADIKVYTIVQSIVGGKIDYVTAASFEPFPKLLALHAAVHSHPKVAEWVARHA